MIFNFLLMAFVAEHPGVALAIIGALGSSIVALIGTYWAMISHRLDKLESTDAQLSLRVQDVEETLVQYKEKVGAGETMFNSLTMGIHNLSNKLGTIHEDNLKAHSAIVERLTRVETKIPNGELTKLIELLDKVASKVGA